MFETAAAAGEQSNLEENKFLSDLPGQLEKRLLGRNIKRTITRGFYALGGISVYFVITGIAATGWQLAERPGVTEGFQKSSISSLAFEIPRGAFAKTFGNVGIL